MNATHEVASWVQRLARLGYAAKGVVYLLIGGLAIREAVSGGGATEGSTGALQTLLDEPMGRVILMVIAIGLAGYVVWRLVQAIRDPERKGSDGTGLAKRAGYLISAVLYGGVGLQAFRMATGSGGGSNGDGGDGQADDWTAMVMDQPFGELLVGVVGVGLALFGCYEFYKAFTVDFGDRLDLADLGADARRRVIQIGRAGLFSRGVVFLLIGWFVVQAAVQRDPQEAGGLEQALETLSGQSYGPWLLGIVAVGLFAYGLFQIVKTRYRTIRPA